MKILVTAGNTQTPIDRVRCITNIFSGKTGAQIALEAHRHGHSVVLLTSHPGRLTLHHADLYRLRGDGDDRELGLEELPGPRGVLAVEWAERLSNVPWPRPLRVTLDHAGEDARRIRIEGNDK